MGSDPGARCEETRHLQSSKALQAGKNDARRGMGVVSGVLQEKVRVQGTGAGTIQAVRIFRLSARQTDCGVGLLINNLPLRHLE
jgi:hypothetical protein